MNFLETYPLLMLS